MRPRVEDHFLVQQAIRSLLVDHCQLVGARTDANRVAYDVTALEPHVLVLDISLPGRSGMQVLPEIREEFPELGIVMITNHNHPVYRTLAFNRGADAFVPKDHLQEELWPAVQSAYLARVPADALTIMQSVNA